MKLEFRGYKSGGFDAGPCVDDYEPDKQKLVWKWLNQKVKLPQYYNILLQNGFDHLEFIKDMTKQDMIKIGIDKLGHQTRLIKCINKIDLEIVVCSSISISGIVKSFIVNKRLRINKKDRMFYSVHLSFRLCKLIGMFTNISR